MAQTASHEDTLVNQAQSLSLNDKQTDHYEPEYREDNMELGSALATEPSDLKQNGLDSNAREQLEHDQNIRQEHEAQQSLSNERPGWVKSRPGRSWLAD